MLGDYATPLYATSGPRRGRVDIAGTIGALSAAHINTYAYLIFPGWSLNPGVTTRQWQDLPAFADAALNSGIDVFVYLVPPTEAARDAYAPFGWNYREWASNIGRVARDHPSIRGMMIDDFGTNTTPNIGTDFRFTPAYVAEMRALARSWAAWITLSPVLYFDEIVGPGAVLPAFRYAIDGVVFPYSGRHTPQKGATDTVDHTLALSQGRMVADTVKCSISESCTQLSFPARVAGTARPDSATLKFAVRPMPNEKRVLTVSISDDRTPGAASDVSLQLFVNGTMVWHREGLAPGWQRLDLDVTPSTGRSDHSVVELRIIRSREPRGALSVFLDGTRWKGNVWEGPTMLESAVRMSSAEMSASEVRSLPLIFMTYSAPLAKEDGVGASPEYVERVLKVVRQLRDEGAVDGSLMYGLNLSGWANHPRAASSLAVVTDAYESLSVLP
jgi:hypothetical protein